MAAGAVSPRRTSPVASRTRLRRGLAIPRPRRLIRKIEAEMLAHDASLTLCRYSDEPFNTNEVVWPCWSEIPFHPPTAGLAVTVLFAIGFAAWGAWPRRGTNSLRSGGVGSAG